MKEMVFTGYKGDVYYGEGKFTVGDIYEIVDDDGSNAPMFRDDRGNELYEHRRHFSQVRKGAAMTHHKRKPSKVDIIETSFAIIFFILCVLALGAIFVEVTLPAMGYK